MAKISPLIIIEFVNKGFPIPMVDDLKFINPTITLGKVLASAYFTYMFSTIMHYYYGGI